RGDPPAVAAVALELERVMDGVLLLDVRRAPTVLEVVDAPFAHEGVADLPEVDPDMRELVGEERSRVEQLEAVDTLPQVGCGVGREALGRQRVSGTAEGKDVEEERLVIAGPAVGEETAFGLPSVRDRRPTVGCPVP